MPAGRIVVVGIGNPDRGDDAIGHEVVRLLRGRMPAGIEALHRVGEATGLLAAIDTGEIDSVSGRMTQRLVGADAPLTDVDDFGRLLGTTFATGAQEGGAYAGERGLGRLYSMPDAAGAPRAVRPYRRLLSASAGFRREIFGSDGAS